MLQQASPSEREPRLPKLVAEALVAETECEAIIKHREKGGRIVESVPRIEELLENCRGAFSSLYPIGGGYIIAEGAGQSYSEFIAIERSHLPVYLDTIFDGEDHEIILNANADPDWIDELS